MPQLQREPEKEKLGKPRPGHGGGDSGGGSITNNTPQLSLGSNSEIWLVTISLLVLFWYSFPRRIDEIVLFGAKVGPIEGYQDVVNVVLALGLYRVASLFVRIVPDSSWQRKLQLSLNLSSKELISVSSKKMEPLAGLGNRPQLTRMVWYGLDWIIQWVQPVAALLIFSVGMYSASKMLYLSYTTPALPTFINWVVLSLASLFLLGTLLRVIQAISFPASLYVDKVLINWKQRREAARLEKEKQIQRVREEKEEERKRTQKVWLEKNALLIELLKAADAAATEIKLGREFAIGMLGDIKVWEGELPNKLEKFRELWKAFEESWVPSSNPHLYESIMSVSKLLSEANELDLDSPDIEDSINELCEKYEADVDVLRDFLKDPFKSSSLKEFSAN